MQPYKVFTIYAREDTQYLEELRGKLARSKMHI